MGKGKGEREKEGKGGKEKGREGRGASCSVSASTVVAVLTSWGEVTALGQILTCCQKLGLSGNKAGRLCRAVGSSTVSLSWNGAGTRDKA